MTFFQPKITGSVFVCSLSSRVMLCLKRRGSMPDHVLSDCQNQVRRAHSLVACMHESLVSAVFDWYVCGCVVHSGCVVWVFPGRVQWQRSLLPDSSSWMLDSRLASELCARWQIRKDQLPCRWDTRLFTSLLYFMSSHSYTYTHVWGWVGHTHTIFHFTQSLIHYLNTLTHITYNDVGPHTIHLQFLFSSVRWRWPRLPAETSSPLDFGAVPVNESKVTQTCFYHTLIGE